MKIGVKYLSNLIERFNGNVLYSLAAYNAGPERVDTWVKQWGTMPTQEFIEMIPYEETRNYIKLVFRNFITYKRLSNTEAFKLDKDFLLCKFLRICKSTLLLATMSK